MDTIKQFCAAAIAAIGLGLSGCSGQQDSNSSTGSEADQKTDVVQETEVAETPQTPAISLIAAEAAWSQFVDSGSSGTPQIVGRFILDGAGKDCANYIFEEPAYHYSVTASARSNPDSTDFPVTVCQGKFGSNWNSAQVLDKSRTPLKVKAGAGTPQDISLRGPASIGTRQKSELRMISIGDTGCTTHGPNPAPCSLGTTSWPFSKVIAKAATENPDFIIHVGDYRYWNEGQAKDLWKYWKNDFFTPAQELLASAPWAFSRGNHEKCDYNWYGSGFFYFFEATSSNATKVCSLNPNLPDDYPNWAISLPQITLSSGDKVPPHEFVMIDTSTDGTARQSKWIGNFSAAIKRSAGKSTWWVSHKPAIALGHWGGSWQQPDRETRSSLQQALGASVSTTQLCGSGGCSPSLYMAGHEHFYEYITFAGSPDVAIVGHGGTSHNDNSGLSNPPCTDTRFSAPFPSTGVVENVNAHGYVIWSRTSSSAKSEKIGWAKRPVFLAATPAPSGSPSNPCSH